MIENECKWTAEFFRTVLLKLSYVYIPLGDLVKNVTCDSVGLDWSLGFCISHKLIANADDASPGPHLE